MWGVIMCNCHSYNGDDIDSGKDQEVLLRPPKDFHLDRDSVCVDACIADVIQHLWDNNIQTLNSCCGHNKERPSIILESYVTDDDVKNIREIIRQIDQRDFKLMAWKLKEL